MPPKSALKTETQNARGARQPRLLYWFTFHAPEREIRPKRKLTDPYARSLHQVRDAAAFAEVLPALLVGGFNYGGVILNVPKSGFASSAPPPDPEPVFTSNDLLVITTRPPIGEEDDKRKIGRSETALETRVLESLRHVFFERCSRSQVTFQPNIARALSRQLPSFANRSSVVFQQQSGAAYDDAWIRNNLGPRQARLTASYLLFAPRLWIGGPSVLVLFGMAGVETLIWANALRVRYSELLNQILDSNRFTVIMGEWASQPPPRRPTSFSR